jgi:hypothetical protein
MLQIAITIRRLLHQVCESNFYKFLFYFSITEKKPVKGNIKCPGNFHRSDGSKKKVQWICAFLNEMPLLPHMILITVCTPSGWRI